MGRKFAIIQYTNSPNNIIGMNLYDYLNSCVGSMRDKFTTRKEASDFISKASHYSSIILKQEGSVLEYDWIEQDERVIIFSITKYGNPVYTFPVPIEATIALTPKFLDFTLECVKPFNHFLHNAQYSDYKNALSSLQLQLMLLNRPTHAGECDKRLIQLNNLYTAFDSKYKNPLTFSVFSDHNPYEQEILKVIRDFAHCILEDKIESDPSCALDCLEDAKKLDLFKRPYNRYKMLSSFFANSTDAVQNIEQKIHEIQLSRLRQFLNP